MNRTIRNLACGLGIVALGFTSFQAHAVAVATANITLDWSSLSISSPGLTLLPDPIGGGRFANTAYLGVAQAAVNGVTVDSADLAPYNLSFLPITSPFSVNYSAANAISRITADLNNGPAAATLLTTASDRDGNLFNGHFVNAYVGRNARYIVSGTGTLTVSLGYTMDLTSTGVAGIEFSDVFGIVSLNLQQYAPNPTTGGLGFVGSFSDQFQRRIAFSQGESSFSQSGTLRYELANFDSAQDHLVLLEINAFGIPFANSAGGAAQVPEPNTLAALGIGLALLGWARRRNR